MPNFNIEPAKIATWLKQAQELGQRGFILADAVIQLVSAHKAAREAFYAARNEAKRLEAELAKLRMKKSQDKPKQA